MTAKDETPAPAPVPQGNARVKALMERKAKKKEALKILRRYMALSGGVGLIPVPLVDQIMFGGLLAKMLQELCALYGVQISQHRGKAIIAAVLGGAHSEWISKYLLGYVEKYLPGVNPAAQIVIRPAIAAAIAYSLGMLFIHHFDKGAWLNAAGAPKPTPGPLSPPSPSLEL